MERWRHRVTVVTGASSGIGLAIARVVAMNGICVAMAARRAERLTALHESIRAAGGGSMVIPTDVRDERQIVDLFGRGRDAWGGTDVLINNARASRATEAAL